MGGGGGGGGGIVAVNFAYCLKQLTVGITAYEQIIIIYLVRVRGGGGGGFISKGFHHVWWGSGAGWGSNLQRMINFTLPSIKHNNDLGT